MIGRVSLYGQSNLGDFFADNKILRKIKTTRRWRKDCSSKVCIIFCSSLVIYFTNHKKIVRCAESTVTLTQLYIYIYIGFIAHVEVILTIDFLRLTLIQIFQVMNWQICKVRLQSLLKYKFTFLRPLKRRITFGMSSLFAPLPCCMECVTNRGNR